MKDLLICTYPYTTPAVKLTTTLQYISNTPNVTVLSQTDFRQCQVKIRLGTHLFDLALFISAGTFEPMVIHKSLFLELVEVWYLAAGTLAELVGTKD